jgi:cellulose synthase/poly-beta-1,6-N-acetylglucosamine synthase-like glycosyltransferase
LGCSERDDTVLTGNQRRVGIGLVLLLVGALVAAPATAAALALLLVAIVYLGSTCNRLWLSLLGAGAGSTVWDSSILARSVPDRDLPIYTILVPVYHEATVLPGLIASLTRLDYPADKLDVLVLLERDDRETLAAFRALAVPSFVRALIVPDIGPKGKPRACNAGLASARGHYLVVYDAEDRPEPDQLRKAFAAFRASGPNLACVQCKLDFYNADENLLTRWFASEYAAWFDLYLPGLQRARLPIPLGGTSNHFPAATLRALGGWDPYNVTEDADLGIRLARAGLTTEIIDSVTWEEATSHLGNWIRQRSRWTKGYAITWLVHMRHPWRLYRDVGMRGFVSVQLTLGVSVGMTLINPLFWLLTLAWMLSQADLIGRLISGPTFHVGSASLYVGNWVVILTAMIGCFRRGHFRVVKYTLLLPIYWALTSIAAWKGVLQLWRRPAFWEKTDHGQTSYVGGSLGVVGAVTASNRTALTPLTAVTSWSPSARPLPESTSPARHHPAGRSRSAPRPAPALPLFGRIDAAAWLIFGTLAAAAGLWASLHQHAHHGDALARTYSALQVVHGNEPKLANVGLIWPVLPTLLQVPLAAVAPGLATKGAIGPIVSGFAFGGCVMFLNQIVRFYLPGRAIRWLVLALFFANPLLLQLITSGTSEMAFLSFVLLGWWGVEVATRGDGRVLIGTVMAACGASGAFHCRYEGATIGVALLASLIGLLIARAWQLGTLRQAIPALHAGAVIFLTCFAYAIALFVFFNFTIMGDGLYFARGTGSNDQLVSDWLLGDSMISGLVGDPVAAAGYSVTATWSVFAGLVIVVPIAIVVLVKGRDLRLVFLMGIALMTPAQQTFLMYRGQSFGWERFYVASAFFGVLLIAAVAKALTDHPVRIVNRLVLAGCVVLVAFSSAVAWRMEGSDRVASDFSPDYLKRLFALTSDATIPESGEEDGYRIGVALAQTILADDPDALILADDLKANQIILFSGKLANFIVPNNQQFDRSVADPVGNVQYVLVPVSASRNVILEQYPDLLTGGVPFLTLVATYQEYAGDRDRWLLFRVDARPAQAASTAPVP